MIRIRPTRCRGRGRLVGFLATFVVGVAAGPAHGVAEEVAQGAAEGVAGGDPCEAFDFDAAIAAPADVNLDGTVGLADLLAVLSDFGPSDPAWSVTESLAEFEAGCSDCGEECAPQPVLLGGEGIEASYGYDTPCGSGTAAVLVRVDRDGASTSATALTDWDGDCCAGVGNGFIAVATELRFVVHRPVAVAYEASCEVICAFGGPCTGPFWVSFNGPGVSLMGPGSIDQVLEPGAYFVGAESYTLEACPLTEIVTSAYSIVFEEPRSVSDVDEDGAVDLDDVLAVIADWS